MQTQYDLNMTAMLAGQILDARTSVIESPAAFETITFGRGLTSANASDTVRTPRRNTATIVLNADLVTSNVVNGKVNGTAIAAQTYASSHLNSMNLVKAAIETVLTALGIVGTVTVGGASNRTITVVAQDANILFADWVVTLGASQATITHAYTTADAFRGVASIANVQQNASGVAQYDAGDSVSCIRRGLVAVTVDGAVTAEADAYCVLATSGKEGRFTATSTGNIGPVGKFRSAAADGALAKLELNLP